MTDGITADDDDLIFFCHIPDHLVEIGNNLCAGLCPVIKTPAIGSNQWIHLESPFSKQIKRGKVMFHKLISPFADGFHILTDIRSGFRMRRIQTSIMRKSPFRFNGFVFIQKKTYPDTRTGSSFLDCIGQSLHIREFCISLSPGTSVVILQSVMLLPTVIHNHKRRILKTFCQTAKIVGISKNLFLGTVSICIIPVIASINRFFRKDRIRTHSTTKRTGCFKDRTLRKFTAYDSGCAKRPSL